MYFLKLFICVLIAYLAGSLNFAILISWWARDIDIRKVGNKNPGTSNVRREVGMGWAAVVFLGDLVKGLIPLLLSKLCFFPEDNYADYFALFIVGMGAIAGHCWPLYHQFRGGGGLATSIGIYMFFIPLEFLATLTISFLLVRLFLKHKKYSVGQLTPMIFVPLAPVILILSSILLDIKCFSRISTGNYPWYVITGVTALSLYIFIINIRIVQGRFLKTTDA